MTRINSAIPVERLTDEHLLAEHREIKRLCNNFAIRKKKNKFDDIPKNFTLGTGHILFWIDKPHFTLRRYWELYHECIFRNFDVTDFSINWYIYKDKIKNLEFKDYKPCESEKELLIHRIEEKINSSPKPNWHYYGKSISKNEAVCLLNGLEIDKPKLNLISLFK